MNRTLYWFAVDLGATRRARGEPPENGLKSGLILLFFAVLDAPFAMILYQEYAPHPALRAHVACMWTCVVRSSGPPVTHRVLPDNCIDILWQDRQEASFAVGMMTAPVRVVTLGAVRTVAVRFKPGAAACFLSLPLIELCDERADLRALWGSSDAERIADGLWARDLGDRQRIDLIERHLLARLRAQTPSAAHALVGAALDAIEDSGGAVRIDALAAALGVSRQHLAGQFRARVGLTPKMFSRVCRFRRAAERAAAAPPRATDWAQLALDVGYFDQSHLIHDFQQFAGSTPDAFGSRAG